MTKHLTIFDANSLIHRAYHALPPLSGPGDIPTQALYGVSLVLLRLMGEAGGMPYAAACFDRPETTERKKKYADYKATRPQAPDDLVSQIIEAHDLFKKFGISVFEAPGHEADDCIATLAERFVKDSDVVTSILTGDMDTLQLVRDGRVLVRAFRVGVTDTVTYDAAAVVAKFGVPPSGMIDYKSLSGDPSDNIKGVPGVGPKTAVELINKFGSLDGIYSEIDKIPVKLRQKLEDNKKEAMLSRELVILNRNVPLKDVSIDDLFVECDKDALISYFEKLGFGRLIARIKKNKEAEDVGNITENNTGEATPKRSQGSMF